MPMLYDYEEGTLYNDEYDIFTMQFTPKTSLNDIQQFTQADSIQYSKIDTINSIVPIIILKYDNPNKSHFVNKIVVIRMNEYIVKAEKYSHSPIVQPIYIFPMKDITIQHNRFGG